VYGTNVPTSDTDYKSIFIPKPQEIILQRAPKVITNNTKVDQSAKNSATDVDDESISLQQFLKLLSEGQTPMIDMLFTPRHHWQLHTLVWDIIKINKEKLLTKKLDAVVGYVGQQANKYGVKGSRMNAVLETIVMLEPLAAHAPKSTLNEHKLLIESFVKARNTEHISINMIDEKSKGIKPYLQVCGRNAPFNGTVKHALDMYKKVYDQYGHRAKQAASNEGVDFKALYHAVRVAAEAKELLLTGNITFPRPEASLLLQIRKGELPYAQIAELIEQGLEDVKAAQAVSTLRETADLDWIDGFVYSVYYEHIRRL
jgi:predicted nucleotidyltransferase